MKVVLFCGHRSPFGFHHIEPLLNSRFDVAGVILATPQCWQIFTGALSGISERPASATIKYTVIRTLLVDHPVQALTRKLLRRYMIRSGITANERDRQNHHIQPVQDIDRFLKAKRVPGFYFDDVNNNNNDCMALIRSLNADLLMCAAYPQIFKLPLLKATRFGGC